MKVLVTGAGGFLGSHLVESLMAAGHDVVAAARGLRYKVCELVPLHIADLAEAHQVQELMAKAKPEAVVHAAGLASTPKCLEFPVQCYRDNLEACFNMLEVSRAYKVKRFVNISSNVVYGAPTPYRTCKLDAEAMVNSYFNNYDLSSCNLRLGNLYGAANDHGLVAAILESKKHGLDFQLNGWNARRHWLHVDDACRAVEKALRVKSNFTIDVCECETNSSVDLLEAAGIEFTINNHCQPGDAKELPQSCVDAHHDLGWSAREGVLKWLRHQSSL